MENFTTEFNGTFAFHLDRGQYFEIEVQTIDNPKKLHIAFAKEKLNKNQDTDIGFNMIMNFVENHITCNSRYGGQWVNPISENCDIYKYTKEAMKITIHLWEESFNVAINGEHKVRLYYCGNIHLLQAIQIDADIRRIVRIDHRNTYPKPWPLWCRVHRGLIDEGTYFSSDMPAPPYQGLMVLINVRCYGEMGRLIINTKHEDRSKLFAHFSIRFDEGVVVRNNMLEGNYGAEERDGSFPFDFARDFRFGIALGEKAFLVAVDGAPLCTFTYRDSFGCQLSDVGGFNVHSTLGLMFKITEFSYIPLNGPECKNYERHTIH